MKTLQYRHHKHVPSFDLWCFPAASVIHHLDTVTSIWTEQIYAFAELRKRLLILLCVSVRLSVRMAQLGCQRANFNDIYYLRIFRKFVEKIEV